MKNSCLRWIRTKKSEQLVPDKHVHVLFSVKMSWKSLNILNGQKLIDGKCLTITSQAVILLKTINHNFFHFSCYWRFRSTACYSGKKDLTLSLNGFESQWKRSRKLIWIKTKNFWHLVVMFFTHPTSLSVPLSLPLYIYHYIGTILSF